MTPDPRLNAYRSDIADVRLKDAVAAARFVEGVPRRVVADAAPLKRAPATDAPMDSEVLRGEIFTVFDATPEGWSWGQLKTDGYVGYVPTGALGSLAPEPTHRVTALRAFIYPGPDMKLPPAGVLSFGGKVALAGETVTRGTAYRHLARGEGAIVASQTAPLATPLESDFVAAATRFLNVAYLWGGRTSLGLDCSALVQLSLGATGRTAPRDTDLQEGALGSTVEGGASAPLHRGDLVFWRGHVGIMIDGENMIHAAGHAMAVVIEPLTAVVARTGPPSSVRRFS
jgi:Bacterial dipeptidyl-peptidase Sh3 domain/NlpC/P60 family